MAGEDFVGINKEATFDTYVAPNEWINAISESFSGEHATDLETGMFFSSARSEGRGRTTYTGGITSKLTPFNIGHLLRAMLGSPTSTQPNVGPDPTVWEHLFEPNNGIGRSAKSASVLISRSFNLAEFQFTGFSPSSISFEATLDQDIRFTADGPANDELVVETPVGVPAISVVAPFNHHDSTFRLGSTPTEQLNVEAWSLDISADTMMPGSIGSIKGRRVHRSAFAITGRVDEDFDTLARYKQFLGSDTALSPQTELTAQNVEIKIVGDVITGGSGTFNYELLFKLPTIKFFSSEANQEGRERTVQGTPFTALFDDVTNNYEMQILLRNTEIDTVFT